MVVAGFRCDTRQVGGDGRVRRAGISASIVGLVLAASGCGGEDWTMRLQDPEVMTAYHQKARESGTTLEDERLDDMARRLCTGWSEGQDEDTLTFSEFHNTPILERIHFYDIATAAHRIVCPSA